MALLVYMQLLKPNFFKIGNILIFTKKGHTPTVNIKHQIQRMSNLSKWAAGSGSVLTGLNLKMACDAIGQAEAKLEKNQIFAETLGGLGMAGRSLAYGSLGKRLGRDLYDLSGRKVDLVSVTGVSHVCR